MDKFSSRTGFDGWGKHFLVAKLSEPLPGAHQFFYTLEKVIYEKQKKYNKTQKIHKNPKNHHINILTKLRPQKPARALYIIM